MRLGKIAILSAFIYASVANAQDVMVDLSVLDNLATPEMNISKPLFPVLPKKAKPKIRQNIEKPKAKVIRKRAERAKVKKVIEPIKPLDEDIVVVDVEPVSPVVQPQTLKKNDVVANENDLSQQPANKAKETIPQLPEIIKTEPQQTPQHTAKDQESVKVSEKDENNLIVKESSSDNKDDNYIKFADDIDELNDAQMLKIDSIVSGYKNEPKNKIAIYSYNFDDGADSFKKKRISLNRAVGIRSYLLKKGYKNFSIKVININSPSDKSNTVELQEI